MHSLSKRTRKILAWLLVPLVAGTGVFPVGSAQAQVAPDPQAAARALARANGLESLRLAITAPGAIGQPLLLDPGKVPLPDNLGAFLNPQNTNARRVAAQLGKALFWDQAIGSDGQACASCHFHAGADSRVKNQLNPNLTRAENARQGDVIGFHSARAAADLEFQLVGGGKGPNYTLRANNFPFVKDIGSGNANGQNVVPATTGTVPTVGPAPGNTNDTSSSQGAFFTKFEAADPDPVLPTGVENLSNPFALGSEPVQLRDKGTPQSDPAGFQVSALGGAFNGKANVRRVEPRNTPTMINAVFNLHNFWDGRANFHFNGVNPFGNTDPDARIFVRDAVGNVSPQRVDLKSASLASQAVGPPLSNFEMSFDGRQWPNVGKKMVNRYVLESQDVAPDDSLLGELRTTLGTAPLGKGINIRYKALIQQAFNPNLWDSNQTITFPNATVNELAPNVPFLNLGTPLIQDLSLNLGTSSTLGTSLNLGGALNLGGSLSLGGQVGTTASVQTTDPNQVFTQMEANFSFFFGVAVMLYEAELVADQSKFDLFMEGKATLTDPELTGLEVFVGKGKCANCHGGPELSKATVSHTQAGADLIEPMPMGDTRPALYDNGFYNIGVTPTVEDLGRGGKGPGGAPLASSRQFLFADDGLGSINFPILGAPIRGLTPVGPVFDANGFCLQPILQSAEPGVPPVAVGRDMNCDGVLDVNDQILIQRAAVDGAFKTPQLRNVALTGPYWHNGGILTLMQVVEFYNQGGNFCKFNFPDLDPDIQPLGLTPGEKEGLVEFLLTLTDDRVRKEMAPFDHPELRIPNGHPGDENATTADPAFLNTQAMDSPQRLPAVGAAGVGAGQELKPFHTALDPLLTHFDSFPVANVPCQRPNPPAP